MISLTLALVLTTATLIGVLVVFFKREIRSFQHRKSPWCCLRCGRCCRLNVLLKRSDIERFKNAGYQEDDFITRKFGIPFLKKKIDGTCIFLQEHNEPDGQDWTECTVYELRADIGRRFPEIRFGLFSGKDLRCPGVGTNDKDDTPPAADGAREQKQKQS